MTFIEVDLSSHPMSAVGLLIHGKIVWSQIFTGQWADQDSTKCG